jgi:mono/diheme cytochrome c family protein
MKMPVRKILAASALAALVGSIVGAAAQYQGWDITRAGAEERSPLASVPGAAARGQAIFQANCTRCHGPEGKGDGPDSDHAADLTDELRESLNPDGVLFYKVWGGHAIQLRTQVDDMPAFRGKLSRDEVWAIVEYLKVLRTPQR